MFFQNKLNNGFVIPQSPSFFTRFQFISTGDVEKSTICKLVLDAAKVAQFKDAIENSYWFEFFMGIFYINASFYGFLCSLNMAARCGLLVY